MRNAAEITIRTAADGPRYVERLVRQGWGPGDRVICIDDTGWLIPDPGYEHLAPKKGETYTIAEYATMGGVGAVSLVGGNPDDYYRACRFRRVSA